MCYPKPGPRCSNHAKQSLDAARKKTLKAKRGGDKAKYKKAVADLKRAMDDYDSTKAGQESLDEMIQVTQEFLDGQEKDAVGRSSMENRLHTYEERKHDGQIKRYVAMERHKAKSSPNGSIDADGNVFYNNSKGQIHREDGPAFVDSSGDKEWYQNDFLHREDGPAVETADGQKYWYRHGQLHREDGPAKIYTDTDMVWYQNGKLHRENGPAIVSDEGVEQWYQNGQLHRDPNDGPAVVGRHGSVEYWENGEYLGDEKP